MTSTKELLAQYNELSGKNIKAWKASRASLEAKIKELVKEPEAPPPVVAEAPKAVEHKNVDSVAQLAVSIGMNAKVARAKLRRHGVKWNGKNRDAVVALLKGDKRKPGM